MDDDLKGWNHIRRFANAIFFSDVYELCKFYAWFSFLKIDRCPKKDEKRQSRDTERDPLPSNSSNLCCVDMLFLKSFHAVKHIIVCCN